MPIEHVSRSVVIDNLCVSVEADRYICDDCGARETFADIPMPDGHSESDARLRGWHLRIIEDEEVFCPFCVAKDAARHLARFPKDQG